MAGALALGWMMWLTAGLLVAAGHAPDLVNKDFANYWMAGRLVLSGQTLDLFGPQPGYFAHMTAAFGPDYPWHNWSYPPHYLFLVSPLGLFGYKSAMALFLGLTCAFYLWTARRFAGPSNPLIWIAVLPFLAHNLWAAQNGFLIAGCALAVLALRGTRPVLAGVLLGLLTVKPQLGILFPFLLLAERRWLVIASATVTTVALMLASAAVFGTESWRGYIAEVVPYQTHVMRDFEGVFLWMMPSVYGALRGWGFDADVALPVHLVLALPVMAVTVAAFFLVRDDEDRNVLLVVATFIVTPYALSYDLGLVAPALAVLAARLPEVDKGRGLMLAGAMLLPVVMIPLGMLSLAIAPALLLAVHAIALRESDVWRRARTIFGPAKPGTTRSPGAASG